MYQYRSHDVTPKEANSPFHAPDTLAWEWGKYEIETVLERKRHMRMSMASLIRDRLDRYTFQHLYGESLMRFFSHINALGVEQMQEDRAALSSVPSVDVREALEASVQTGHIGDRD